MKKRILLTAGILAMSAGLFGCGSALKQLPEVSEENIYNEEEETTGNEVADDILDELDDDGEINGDVTSFIIYDREDNEDTKEKSEISVEVTSESDAAEYVNYYIVTLKYNDDRGWRVKEYEADEDEDASVTPKKGVEVSDVEDALTSVVYSTYFGDTYVYLEDATNIEITDEDMDTSSDSPVDNVTVTFDVKGDYAVYTGSVDMVFDFTSDGKWYISDYTVSEDYTSELSEETAEALSDDNFAAPIYEEEFYLGGQYVTLTEDDVESVELTDYSFSGNYCERVATIELANDELMPITIDATIDFYYYDNGWEFDYMNYEVTQGEMNFSGKNYVSDVYSDEEMSGDKLARVHYSILDAGEDGCWSGAIKWVPEGTAAEDAAVVAFTTSYNADRMRWECDFDEDVEDGTYWGMSYEYLYYNPLTNTLDARDNYSHYYSLSEE